MGQVNSLERTLVLIDIISMMCSLFLLHRLWYSSWSIKIMLRVVTFITAGHFINSSLYVLQLFPPAFHGTVVPWKDSWFCQLIGFTMQITAVADFLWSGLFVWLFLMLLLGKSSYDLEKLQKFQIAGVCMLTLLLALIPFADRATGGYGYLEHDVACWILTPDYRVTLYGVFIACVLFSVVVLGFAMLRRHLFTQAPVLRKMTLFVGFFCAFWALPCSRRILEMWGYDPFSGTALVILRTLTSFYGIGNCALWAYLMYGNQPRNDPRLTLLAPTVSTSVNPEEDPTQLATTSDQKMSARLALLTGH